MGQLLQAVVVVHIHLELAQALVDELAGFDFDQHEELQQPVVEYEVHEKVVVFEVQLLLPGHEAEPVAWAQLP